jgi:hypothetical protein
LAGVKANSFNLGEYDNVRARKPTDRNKILTLPT